MLLLSGSYVPAAVLVVDMRPLLTIGAVDGPPLSEPAMNALFDEESADTKALGKKLGKAIGRELAKVACRRSLMCCFAVLFQRSAARVGMHLAGACVLNNRTAMHTC